MNVINLKGLIVLAISFGIALSSGPRSPQEPRLEPIRVGVFLDLSGQTSSFGRATLNGIKLAASELNANGGKRYIELIVEDDSGRPYQAATVVQRLIGQKKVHALIGDVISSNSLAAAPIAQNAKVPMITSATHPVVTDDRDYVFRLSYIDPFQGEALAKFAVKTLKAKRAALLVDYSSDYSKSLATAFEKSLISLGGHILIKQQYVQGDKDFAAQLTAIKWSKPDVVFVPGYTRNIIKVSNLTLLRRLDMTP